MAFYMDEEEVWKCPKHPSKRRRTGICPTCLRDRLSSLCPDCAHARPCSCITTTTTTTTTSSSSSSSSSSFSRAVGRVSNLIDNEPSFRRSRSVAIPFLRSKSRFVGGDSPSKSKTPSFWSLLKKGSQSKRSHDDGDNSSSNNGGGVVFEERIRKGGSVEEEEEERKVGMMRKSRSVAVTSATGGDDVRKGRTWYHNFPSPMKVFRQSKIKNSKVKVVLHQPSP